MNKKKIFGLIVVLAITAMAAFNVNVNTQENGLSDVSLENVEALAEENAANNRYKERISRNWTATETIDGESMQCYFSQVSCIGEGSVICKASYKKECYKF